MGWITLHRISDTLYAGSFVVTLLRERQGFAVGLTLPVSLISSINVESLLKLISDSLSVSSWTRCERKLIGLGCLIMVL
ncbi:hypothetical protein F2Q70_00041265 [Brassica cretica]|uniref:Uncharacterized protein n=1 Tax=Brassica cretica TaxID=69181 RepID=A0A8S9KDZ3_BRACR|nr:hypothetical protein F2Q70_00041265 [Brassica cretica]